MADLATSQAEAEEIRVDSVISADPASVTPDVASQLIGAKLVIAPAALDQLLGLLFP